MRSCIYTALLLIYTSVLVRAEPSDDRAPVLFQKEDLNKIRKEVEQSRSKLDSLKEAEFRIQKSLSEFDQKIATNRKIVARLNRELKQSKRNIARVEEELARNRELLERCRRRYLGNIRQFYFTAHKPVEPFTARVNDELEIDRQIVYLTALAGFESGNIAQVSAYLSQADMQLTRLVGEKRKVSSLKKKKETATALEKTRKQKEQRALEQLRRKKSEEADRILTLEQAAQEIEQIIARLERRRRQSMPLRPAQTSGSSAFITLQGQLLSPFRGKIVVVFGHSEDKVTKLKSFSPGITIKGKAGGRVTAVADGTVAYIGNLRGYGNFVIIDHGDQYYSTYGGLGKTSVEINEYVVAGTTLALADRAGRVRFELRHGREPLDPVKWIRIDSF